MLSASSRGHGHEHSGVPTKLEQSFFPQKVTANPWPQTNRSELLSKSCHLKLRILHLLVRRFGLLMGTGKQQVFQLCFESNENMMNMKNEIKWKARSSMNATHNNALQDNYFKHFQTTISQWCSINVPFKVPPWLLHGRRLCPSVQPKMSLHLLPSTIFLVKTPRIRSDCNIRSLSRSKRTEADSVWRACSWDKQKGNSLLSEAPKITKNCQESLS